MKNNNPCNLRYVGQKGAEPGYKDFAYFQTPEDGMRACLDQIDLDGMRGHSLTTFIHKFAPEFENDTAQYIRFVAGCVGERADALIARIHPGKLARCMVQKESSTIISS